MTVSQLKKLIEPYPGADVLIHYIEDGSGDDCYKQIAGLNLDINAEGVCVRVRLVAE